ncbi:MAG TPA: hypothetical protein VMW27_29875 [Thermoanaerobaculia bacterium]|nr:hypothetical protein [Thermoanaerobaculia bacterium]
MDDTTRRAARSFPIDLPGALRLVTSRFGAVRIEGTDQTTITLEVLARVDLTTADDCAAALESIQVTFDRQRRRAEVVARAPRAAESSWFRRRRERTPKLDLRIALPRACDIEIEAIASSVSIADIEGRIQGQVTGGAFNAHKVAGEVQGRVMGGSVIAADCTGPAELQTSGGSIYVWNLAGDLNLRAAGGFAIIERVRGSVSADVVGGGLRVEEVTGSLAASAAAGSVLVRLAERPQGDCALSAQAGNVVVHLPANLGADIDAQSHGGQVMADFPEATGTRRRQEASLRINGGGLPLRLRSHGGDIYVGCL